MWKSATTTWKSLAKTPCFFDRRCNSNLMSMQNSSINWPAIVKYTDDAELTYFNGQTEWENNINLRLTDFEETDYLIDSSGAIYSLIQTENDNVIPKLTGNSKTLNEVLGLVKEHASQAGSCCVAKLYAPTIEDAFKIVQSLNND